MDEIDLIINQFILEQGRLPPLPELYQQLDEKIHSNVTSMDEIGQLISIDAALSTQILRIANSSLFGFRSEVTTLKRALSLIGLKEVKSLVLLDTVTKNFINSNKTSAVKLEDFWRRSIYIALIAKRLAKKIHHKEPEQLFINGLISRIGQLVASATLFEETTLIMEELNNTSESSEFDIENKHLGFTYNKISARLLEHWKLPNELIIPIQELNNPLELSGQILKNYGADICILHLATVYSNFLEFDEKNKEMKQSQDAPNFNAKEEDSFNAENYFQKVDPRINKALNMDAESIDNILLEIEIDSLEILNIIFPQSMSIY